MVTPAETPTFEPVATPFRPPSRRILPDLESTLTPLRSIPYSEVFCVEPTIEIPAVPSA